MSRQNTRGRPAAAAPSAFDQARDELFQQVMRCGVIGSAPEHQTEWFDETMKYFGERYHELTPKQVADLRVLGQRFAAPSVRSSALTEASAEASAEVSAEVTVEANVEDAATEGALDAATAV